MNATSAASTARTTTTSKIVTPASPWRVALLDAADNVVPRNRQRAVRGLIDARLDDAVRAPGNDKHCFAGGRIGLADVDEILVAPRVRWYRRQIWASPRAETVG